MEKKSYFCFETERSISRSDGAMGYLLLLRRNDQARAQPTTTPRRGTKKAVASLCPSEGTWQYLVSTRVVRNARLGAILHVHSTLSYRYEPKHNNHLNIIFIYKRYLYFGSKWYTSVKGRGNTERKTTQLQLMCDPHSPSQASRRVLIDRQG